MVLNLTFAEKLMVIDLITSIRAAKAPTIRAIPRIPCIILPNGIDPRRPTVMPRDIQERATAIIGPILTSFAPLESLRQRPNNVSKDPITIVPFASIPESTIPRTITPPTSIDTPRTIPINVLNED